MNTMTKASVSARINALIRRLDHASDAYKTSPKKKTSDVQLAAGALTRDLDAIQKDAAALYREMQEKIKEECTPGFHYDKQMVDAAMEAVRKKMRERFGHFPIAAAMIEAMMMTIETETAYFATIWALRNAAGAEDRQNSVHQSFYHINGEPNDIGNRVGKPQE